MNLQTQTEFSKLAGVSKMAISKAIKAETLRYFPGTKKIDPGDALSQAYLNNPSISRISANKAKNLPAQGEPVQQSDDVEQTIVDVNKAQIQKIIEEAELKRQQRIKVQLQNATRRGELVELKAIEKLIMMFYDRWLNTNKRRFNGKFDELKRDLDKGEKSDAEIKRDLNNSFENWANEAKETSCELLIQIQEGQGKK